MERYIRHVLIAGLLVAAGLGLVYLSTYKVSESEYVILTQFGKPSGAIQEAGLHWKLPGFLETINRFDRRIHIFATQPIQLMLGDKNPIVLTSFICWRIQDPLLFFQSLANTETATQKLGDMINSQLGNALGDLKITNIINTDVNEIKLEGLESAILKNINAGAKDKYGIEVVQAGISRIAYPTVVADAVYNRMKSEREKEALKYRAEGREEATKIKAKADREVTEILSEAYKQAQILKGQGDQKALEIYSKAYGKDREFFEFTKSMETYRDILGAKSTLVISTDSDMLKYLNNPKGAEYR
ncbi:MAG: protease modulator HflC [Deltaproteobacteria bacterium]|nr:protease modulator HflC [Deltaproteobacteria bacterium]